MHFYENAGEKSARKTCNHFAAEGYQYRSISRILKRCIERQTTELLPRHRNLPTVRTPEFIEQVRELYEAEPCVSKQAAAVRLNATPSTVQRAKKQDLGINAYTKQVAPKYRKNQAERAKVGCGTILVAEKGHPVRSAQRECTERTTSKADRALLGPMQTGIPSS